MKKLQELTLVQPAPTIGDSSWFTRDRFGMFIHWGLYALPARHEWIRNRERISNEAYEKYFRHFDPDLYDPKLWADAAAYAGMKYFVITTKHHEGFCLWDSAYTDYKSTNTPYGKDILTPMVEAFRDKGLRTGFYHSIIDWHHPDYTVDRIHPMRDNEEYIAGDAQRDLSRYVDYLHNQTEELLKKYDPVDIIWFDFSVSASDRFPGKGRSEWRAVELLQKIRAINPKILIDDRLQIDQDIKTPEQRMPGEWVKVNGVPVVWEGCHTFSGSWGYYRDEESWKSVDQLLMMLIDSVSKGGNLLLNVGPTGRGEFDERAYERLRGMGDWMKRHSRSIYGCTQAPLEFECPPDCRLTYNPETRRLYLHCFTWPFGGITLQGELAEHVDYAQILSDASEIRYIYNEETRTLQLNLPVKKPLNARIPVIELFLK